MVLKLYGQPLSTATRLAAVALVEKQVPFEFVVVDTTKLEHKTPEYLKIHPFGQIPYIDDDGFVLYESRAIARYIAEKYADQGTPELIPTSSLHAKALFEQAASVEFSDFDFFASRALREVYQKKRQGLEPDFKVVDDALAALNGKLDAYEAILSRTKYLAGDQITLADLFHLPFGSALPTIGSDAITSRPNVKRWFDEVSSRPAWQQVKGRLVNQSGSVPFVCCCCCDVL
ncbi:glutathione S-transferase [Panaeolus papilionaceus]|nr:glutathione S-transferase [Panaeolus papilionaceus]